MANANLSTRRRFLTTLAGSFAQVSSKGAVCVTRGPKNHFLSYHGVSSFSRNGRYILVHQTSFCDRAPKSEDRVKVGVLDRVAGGRFLTIAESGAWSWPWGSHAAWLPQAAERCVVFNDRRGDQLISKVVDLVTGIGREIPFPVFSLHPRLPVGAFLNFARLAWTTPGYGCAAVADPFRHAAAPPEDGLFVGDLEKGKSWLVVSLDGLVRYEPLSVFGDAYHWIQYTAFSPTGDLLAFVHAWKTADRKKKGARVFVTTLDGKKLRLLCSLREPSPLLWLRREKLVLRERRQDGLTSLSVWDLRTGSQRPFPGLSGEAVWSFSFSTTGRFLVGNTPSDREGYEVLFLVDSSLGQTLEIGRYPCPPPALDSKGNDLSPQFSLEGREVYFDGVVGSTRQVYKVEIEGSVFW